MSLYLGCLWKVVDGPSVQLPLRKTLYPAVAATRLALPVLPSPHLHAGLKVQLTDPSPGRPWAELVTSPEHLEPASPDHVSSVKSLPYPAAHHPSREVPWT